MRGRDADGADQDEKNFHRKIFLKKNIRKNDENDSCHKEKQSSNFAVHFEISRQQTDRSDGDGSGDENVFHAFARQKRYAEQRQKRNDKRHCQTMNRAHPRNRRACFIKRAVRLENLKI